ncbi:ectonucleoside triphosphate diphosphohydrolase 3 [Triplophysa rosa]|uniref:Ectonucleoside triphosphate diphosphohydrolase 3 n=1 Tax=Triplophysa rosa TaxID=992332 RepID=A0A9W8C4S0_TRIRA|nr:ectonucleoside triphosphate diphosphohydrolase 3 [Triplophysa rosa]KAI7806954.1 putative ectonucleoside triphosphate diphosphohydrolase 3 [Triplophysa rosa]
MKFSVKPSAPPLLSLQHAYSHTNIDTHTYSPTISHFHALTYQYRMIHKESQSSDHLTAASRRGVMMSKVAIALVAFFLLASVAVIISIAVVQTHKKTRLSPGLKYGIVLDAGSSRTTIYLYEWPAEKENNTGVVTQTMKCQVEGPGISDLRVDSAKDKTTWESFNFCMSEITKAIPAKQHSQTPVFLGATAGMRLLQQKNPERSNTILRDMRNYLMGYPFNFRNASIMSGLEEGLYGWITVNYLMGNFLEKTLWDAWVHPHGANTVGSLDLGGASTQIAFAIPDDAEGEDIIKVSLYGYEYNIYTHSFLCYGRNEAEKRALAKLSKESSNWSNVKNPCYPAGYNITMLAEEIFGSECTKNQITSKYTPTRQITFYGQSNPEQCKVLVRSIFDLTSCQEGENCSFDGVSQPQLGGDFMAYAGFYWAALSLNVTGSKSMETFNVNRMELCSNNWKTLKEKHVDKDIHVKSFCFSANYVHTILADGYKFNADNWKSLNFQKEVNKTSIAWSLGYMLALSNMIPAEGKILKLPIDNVLFTGLLLAFSALTIITLTYLVIALARYCY